MGVVEVEFWRRRCHLSPLCRFASVLLQRSLDQVESVMYIAAHAKYDSGVATAARRSTGPGILAAFSDYAAPAY